MGWLAEPEADARAALHASYTALLLAVGKRDVSAATSAANDATAATKRLAEYDAQRAELLAASEVRRNARAKAAADYVAEHRKDAAARPPASLLAASDVDGFAVSDRDFRWSSDAKSKSKSKSKPVAKGKGKGKA